MLVFFSSQQFGYITSAVLRYKLWNVSLFSSVILRKKVGGDKRDRTVDPLLARQVLSQLSYTPTDVPLRYSSWVLPRAACLVLQVSLRRLAFY